MNYQKIYTEETGLDATELPSDGWPVQHYTNEFVTWQSERLDKLTAFANDVIDSDWMNMIVAEKHGLIRKVDFIKYKKTSLISDKETK